MIKKEKCIIMDIDGTLCPVKKTGQKYNDVQPYKEVIKKLLEYKNNGFYIILSTSRNMRSYDGNLGLINKYTAKSLFEWLDKYDIPYDEIYFGKPWQGKGGFYVDDKTIRPQEFLNLSYTEIIKLIDSNFKK